jgi:hypothetical protein
MFFLFELLEEKFAEKKIRFKPAWYFQNFSTLCYLRMKSEFSRSFLLSSAESVQL